MPIPTPAALARPKTLMIAGMVPVIIGMGWLSRVSPGTASSMVNVMQQVGGALGLAVLVAVFGTSFRDAARHPLAGAAPAVQARHALAHGMSTAFLLAAIFDAVALLVIIMLIRARAPMVAPPRTAEAEEEALAA